MGTGSQRRQGMKRAMTLATAIAAMALGGGTTRAQPAAPTQPAESSAAAPQRSSFSRSAEQEITFQEGLLLYSRNDLARAEANFRSLVEANPADAESNDYLGLTLLDQRMSAAAVESFDRSLRLDPTRTEVRAARATALIRLKRFDDARQDLAALEGDPRWQSLSAYLRGQLLYGEGDLEGAAKAFAQARALGSEEAAPAEFYEGLTYLRMRDLVQARRVFREATGAERDPTLGEAARQLDNVLARQQQAAKLWEFQLTTAVEYDSNAILIGSDVSPPEEISDEADTRYVLQPRGSYSLYRKGKIDTGLEANGYFAFYDDLTDFDVESYQGGPFLTYRINNRWFASARYAFNYVESGHDPFLARHIVTPQLTWVQPKFGYTSGYVQAQFREFSETPSREEFDRDGQIYTFGVVQGINLPEFFRDAGPANLELTYRLEDQRTQGSDFDALNHNVGAALYVPLPFWDLRVDVGGELSFDNYDSGNSLDANGDEREDFEINAVVGLNKEITEWLTARVDYRFTDRDSNVETVFNQSPYDFDRHQVGVRLIFSF
jgi:tetratricopeptide (TPR) repeat protein